KTQQLSTKTKAKQKEPKVKPAHIYTLAHRRIHSAPAAGSRHVDETPRFTRSTRRPASRLFRFPGFIMGAAFKATTLELLTRVQDVLASRGAVTLSLSPRPW
ncbi:unnamed protein product, partial [Prunus brigantina]